MAGRGGFGVLSSSIQQREREHEELVTSVLKGTEGLADGLGMEDESVLPKDLHQMLADQVHQLALANAKLNIKRTATTSAMRSLAAEINKKQSKRSGQGGGAAVDMDEVSQEYFFKKLKAKVDSEMEGADIKALKSEHYRDMMKIVRAAANDDDDEDIVLARRDVVSLVCPLTSKTMEDPMRSKICKHSFGKTAILHHIRVSKGNAACPVAGCLHKVSKNDLEPDKDMQRRLRIDSQTQQVEQEVDAEEVDDDSIGETYI